MTDSLDAVWADIRLDPRFAHLRVRGLPLVPGEGDACSPPAAFVGEAPGAEEAKTGRPFVGPSGQLLDELIEEAGMVREWFWITNTLKYRPPENRDPSWPERLAAREYLRRELRLVRPHVIVTVGGVTTSLIVRQPISRVHGKVTARGRWLYLPMFHPAYVLRKPEMRPQALADMQKLAAIIEQNRSHS